jgi:two-component system response regulator YesN
MMQVIIVEDEPAIARGLSILITQNYPDFEVIALCRNGKEGFEKISQLKPHLVFADINMPIMNGLDMIRQLKQNNIHSRYIILTGYAEFEYARTAIQLGISDYLLKPISPDVLDEILNSCRQQHKAANRILQTEYLQRCLIDESSSSGKNNPLQSYICTLFILFSGPMCGNIYNEALIDSDIQCSDDTLIHQLEQEYSISLLPLHGRHYNECIYAVIHKADTFVDTKELAWRLYDSFRPVDDTYLNLIISDSVTDGISIHDTVQGAYLFALFHNLFGCGSVSQCGSIPNEPIHVSQEIKQICAVIPEQPNREKLSDFMHSMLNYWQSNQVTQFQLVTDLRYFISTVIRDYSDENIVYPDAAEIVSTCRSYDDLEKEMVYETERIYGFKKDISGGHQQSLASQVRSWLDKNFTTQITYKIFQDIFGHNEKYISTLFKEEYGISPSKYIGELRLSMAKKLMQSNPDILTKDVSEMVGFSDAFYFSRVFKAHEGMSPSQYMKRLKS